MTKAERNRVAAEKLRKRIVEQTEKAAGKGVEAAVRFLAARVKETLSIAAPKKAVRGMPMPGKKLGPILYYRVTTPAFPGAPPRLVSGRMRLGVAHRMERPLLGIVGVHARGEPSNNYPGGFNYPKHHEVGDTEELGKGEHPYLLPTVKKYRKELKRILKAELKAAL